jgi:hypothetical protein
MSAGLNSVTTSGETRPWSNLNGGQSDPYAKHTNDSNAGKRMQLQFNCNERSVQFYRPYNANAKDAAYCFEEVLSHSKARRTRTRHIHSKQQITICLLALYGIRLNEIKINCA